MREGWNNIWCAVKMLLVHKHAGTRPSFCPAQIDVHTCFRSMVNSLLPTHVCLQGSWTLTTKRAVRKGPTSIVASCPRDLGPFQEHLLLPLDVLYAVDRRCRPRSVPGSSCSRPRPGGLRPLGLLQHNLQVKNSSQASQKYIWLGMMTLDDVEIYLIPILYSVLIKYIHQFKLLFATPQVRSMPFFSPKLF